MQPVLVIWEDAYEADDSVWVERGETPDKLEACLVHQVGYLVSADDSHVVLTSRFTDDLIGPRFVIPRGMVVSMTNLQSV